MIFTKEAVAIAEKFTNFTGLRLGYGKMRRSNERSQISEINGVTLLHLQT